MRVSSEGTVPVQRHVCSGTFTPERIDKIHFIQMRFLGGEKRHSIFL